MREAYCEKSGLKSPFSGSDGLNPAPVCGLSHSVEYSSIAQQYDSLADLDLDLVANRLNHHGRTANGGLNHGPTVMAAS